MAKNTKRRITFTMNLATELIDWLYAYSETQSRSATQQLEHILKGAYSKQNEPNESGHRGLPGKTNSQAER